MGAILGGGGGTVSTADTRIGSLAISQSTYGIAIPVVFGTARVAGNMIDYIDFTAIPHTTTTRSGGKGGGGGVTSSHTTYTYEVAAIFALCEGPVEGVKRVWKNKEVHTKLEDLRMSVYTGAAGQAPWPWMVGKHPERALGYPETCYIASPNLELLSSATVPSFNYEVAGRDIAPGKEDAAPISIIRGILSDTQIGSDSLHGISRIRRNSSIIVRSTASISRPPMTVRRKRTNSSPPCWKLPMPLLYGVRENLNLFRTD